MDKDTILKKYEDAIVMIDDRGDSFARMLPLIKEYNFARVASALESIASSLDTMDKGTVSILEGEDIVKQLHFIHQVILRNGAR